MKHVTLEDLEAFRVLLNQELDHEFWPSHWGTHPPKGSRVADLYEAVARVDAEIADYPEETEG